MVRKNMVQSVRNERNILAQANNPFVVRLHAAGMLERALVQSCMASS